jgi:hypothetical protein
LPGKAEFYTFIFDKDHKTVQSPQSEIELAPHAQKTIYPYLTAALEPGEYECRFVARDTATGRAVIGRTFFKIPEPLASGMKFDSALNENLDRQEIVRRLISFLALIFSFG